MCNIKEGPVALITVSLSYILKLFELKILLILPLQKSYRTVLAITQLYVILAVIDLLPSLSLLEMAL